MICIGIKSYIENLLAFLLFILAYISNSGDLNLTTAADWFSEVEKSFVELRSKSDRVFVAGFSNGGALALRLAQIRSAEIEGLILLNPIIHDRRLFMKLLPIMRFAIKYS